MQSDPLAFIHELILVQDEVSWRDVLLHAVKSGNLDPWDVDIRRLTEEYIRLIRELKALDFTVSGNMLLAAAILVKMKAESFLEAAEHEPVLEDVLEDLPSIDAFYDALEADQPRRRDKPSLLLVPRTPQLKTRRVSIYELIEALDEAMRKYTQQATRKRAARKLEPVELPEETVDMQRLMRETMERIERTSVQGVTTFSNLLETGTVEEKIYTFLPLLHLAHVETNAILLEQEDAFNEIIIRQKKGA